MATTAVRYLVFDVESVADGAMVSRIQYPGEGLSPGEAITRYREELREKHGSWLNLICANSMLPAVESPHRRDERPAGLPAEIEQFGDRFR